MSKRPHLLATIATIVVSLCACSSALAQGTMVPLPSSDYSIRAACSAPSIGHAGCLALQLVPRTAAAREHTHPIGMARTAFVAAPSKSAAAGDFGLRPQDLHSAYNLPSAPETMQTVALVDAYNDPTAEADLKTYDEEFGLPECTSVNGCFAKVGQSGSPTSLPFPKTTLELEQASESEDPKKAEEAEEAIGWGAEISLDIESAHATCQGCHIVLVEANSTSYSNLGAAEETAVERAQEISNSWGGPEEGVTVKGEQTGPFNQPGIVITASSGDEGFLGWDAESPEERGFTNFPAASPHVVAVGGTRLSLGAGGAWAGESVWNGDGASGGGCSIQFTAPAWQQQASDWASVGCSNKRAVADVAADADPHTGVAVMDSSPACESEYSEETAKKIIKRTVHWCTYGGTSLASPIIAAVFALAGGANNVSYPARTLYENERSAPNTLHDVNSGSNGECAAGYNEETGKSLCEPSQEATASCSGHLSCLASGGYDGPTGVGTPNGILGFKPGNEEEEEEAPPEEAPSKKAPQEKSAQPPGEGQFVFKLPTVAVPNPTPTPSPTSKPKATRSLQISDLSLTRSALIALNRHHPHTSTVGFSFMSNLAGHLRATLLRKTRVHGHTRWQKLPGTVSIAVIAGRNNRHLNGSHPLSTGLYRLMLITSKGTASSLLLHIG